MIAALLALVASLDAGGTLRPEWLVAVLAAVGWIVAVTSYFALFWSTTGQTPGMRLMRLKVIDRRGEPPHLLRALLRVVGLGLAIIPLFAGFLPVLFDARRRGIHDLLAGTTVIHVPRRLSAHAIVTQPRCRSHDAVGLGLHVLAVHRELARVRPHVGVLLRGQP